MTPERRTLALKAHRLSVKKLGVHEIAKKLKLEDTVTASDLAHVGGLILRAEAQRLTDAEWQVMQVLARLEVRRVEIGSGSCATRDVEFAAGKHRGWCAHTIERRLRDLHSDETPATGAPRLGLVHHTPGGSGRIRFTEAGWAFAWATRLIRPNWRVPA